MTSAEQPDLTDYERTMLHADHSTPINRGWRSCPICPVAAVERIVAARLDAVETVLIENRRATTNQAWLWDKVYEALRTPPESRAT